MDNDINFRQILGMKQEDMALLLQVSLSQWAMYTTGRRNLPVVAKLKLAEMLQFSSSNQNKNNANSEIEKHQKAQLQKYFAEQQTVNANLQDAISKKIAMVTKKYNTALKALNFIAFLETNATKHTLEHQNVLHLIKQNNQINLEKNNLRVQAQLQLNLNTLAAEEKLIFQKMQKL